MWNTIVFSVFRLGVGWGPASPVLLLGLHPAHRLQQLQRHYCLYIFGNEGHLIFGISGLWSQEDHVSCRCGEEVHGEVSECLLITYFLPKSAPSSLPWKILWVVGCISSDDLHAPSERGSHWLWWRTALKSKEVGFKFWFCLPLGKYTSLHFSFLISKTDMIQVSTLQGCSYFIAFDLGSASSMWW